MTVRFRARHQFGVRAAFIVLVIAVLRRHAAQTIIAVGLVEFDDMSERMLRIPCQLLDHERCFSLGRVRPMLEFRRRSEIPNALCSARDCGHSSA
jgi:hypothetical protein